VYQPEGLADKLMDASTLLGDEDVGANLAALLATDGGRRMSGSGSHGLNDVGQDNAFAARTSWSGSDALPSPRITQQLARQPSPFRTGLSFGTSGLAFCVTPPGSGSIPSIVTGPCLALLDAQTSSPAEHKSHRGTMQASRYVIAAVMEPSEMLLAGIGSREFNVLELDSATQVRLMNRLEHCHVSHSRPFVIASCQIVVCRRHLPDLKLFRRAMHSRRLLSLSSREEASLKHSSSMLQLLLGKGAAVLLHGGYRQHRRWWKSRNFPTTTTALV
jgi:hypothetical protein